MITFFAIVAFLLFQLGNCLLCLYLMDVRRHRKVMHWGLF